MTASQPILPKYTYTRKGMELIIKTEFPKKTLNSKEVYELIMADEKNLGISKANIDHLKNEIKMKESQIKSNELNIKLLEESIKNVSKHKDWAKEHQRSVLRSLAPKYEEAIKKRVIETFKWDVDTKPDDNRIEMMAQFKEYLSREEEVKELVSFAIFQEARTERGFFTNPFANYEPTSSD